MTIRHTVIRTLIVCCALAAAGTAAAVPQPWLGIWDEDIPENIAGPLSHANPDAPKGGTLRMSAVGTFDNFNPFAPRGLSAAQTALTYETLGEATESDGRTVRALLAESFDVAEDRLSMTVILRGEARFSDGSPVTAADVVMTFERLINEATPTYRSYYSEVTGAQALDGRTVRFTFANTRNRELPLIVAQLPVLPARWLSTHSLGDPQTDPVPGSGPYRYGKVRMGQHVTLVRDPDWWGRTLPLNLGRYNFDEIRIDYYRDATVAREGFLAGESDMHVERTVKDWKQAYDVPAVRDGRIVRAEIYSPGIFGMTGLFMNTRREPLNHKAVREALAVMFDFERLNQTLFFGEYERCTSFFSGSDLLSAPAKPGPEELALWQSLGSGELREREEPGPLPARERMRRAVALLASAGWTLQNGVLCDANGRPMELRLILASPSMQRMFSAWTRNLARIGITVKTELIDQTQYINRLRAFEFDLVMSAVRQSDNPGNEQRNFWGSAAAHKPGSRNYAGIQDPVVDALIERIASPATRGELVTAVRLLDRRLLEGVYVIPGWMSSKSRLAWWADRIAMPENRPKRGIDRTTWWSPGAR